MKIFKKTKIGKHTIYNIFGIKISLKRTVPSELDLKKRVKEVKSLFKKNMGYKLDINNPRTFNEKINCYKMFYNNRLMTRIVDKYEFKNYIKEQLGEGFTVPLLGAWDNVNDIDFDKLPNKFVLKCNAQSSGNFIKIIKDKNTINISELKKQMMKWLRPELTLKASFCKAYYDVPLKIIAEEYIEQIDGQVYDYKFFCFHGSPQLVYVAIDHFPGEISKISLFDLNWNKLDVTYGSHPRIEQKIEKPKMFDKMLQITKKLSKDFPFVRIDFYEVGDKLYLGEMTFYPGGGYNIFSPQEWDYKLGEMLKLPPKWK